MRKKELIPIIYIVLSFDHQINLLFAFKQSSTEKKKHFYDVIQKSKTKRQVFSTCSLLLQNLEIKTIFGNLQHNIAHTIVAY